MKKMRAGLIGAGYISEYHIAALRRLPHVEIVGLVDLDTTRAARTGEKYNVNVYPSMAALRSAGADTLHILTPPHTHAPLTLQALELGCHVLVEKPAATETADCERMRHSAEMKGLQVCVNHSLLYDPQVRRALATVRSGKLGKVVAVDILRGSNYPPYAGGPLPPQYRQAGYPFRDLGVHALYLFEALLGPIEEVQAQWRSVGGEPNLAFDEWRAQVRCRLGLGQFQLSWNVKPLQSQIIIQGTRGVLRVDLFLMFQALRGATPLPKPAERLLNAFTDSMQPMLDVPRGVIGFLRKKILPYHGLQELVRAFYQALDENKRVPVPVGEALRVVHWTEEVARKADAAHQLRTARISLSPAVDVLVTGASGGLGTAIVRRLRSEGTRVRMLVRRIPEYVPEDTEIALGDLGDPEAVERAVRGAGAVVHVGAAMKGGWIEHQCGTIVGTQNVLEACLKHKVRKLVHISSLSVVDWAGARSGQPINELTAYEPRAEERGAYTRAKLAAEKLVREYVQQHQCPAVILRPGQIFGGQIPLLTAAIARKVGKRWLMLGNGKLPLPLVYIDDVVDGVTAALNSALQHGEIIQLVDEEQLTQNEVFQLAAGPEARLLHVPRALVFLGGKFSEWMMWPLRRQSPLALYRLKSALAQRTFTSIYARELLHWRPRVGVREGIRRVVASVARPERASRTRSTPLSLGSKRLAST